MELYVLLRDGANNPSDGDKFGRKGQVVEKDGRSSYSSHYRLLHPSKDQQKTPFFIYEDRVEKL